MTSITIIDVARAAGVSKTTASDALRGHGRVSEATRESVEAAARELGYTTNRSARSLRTATTGAIGLYLPQVTIRSEYYLSFLQGVAQSASTAGYDVTLIFPGTQQSSGHAPHVDGIVICDARSDDPVVDQLLSLGLPTVSCEDVIGDTRVSGVVWSDGTGLIERLLDVLAASGARAPALLGTTTPAAWGGSIHRGYRDWCAGRGIEPAVEVTDFGADLDALESAAATLLREHADTDALVCVADGVAARVAPFLVAQGLDLGEGFLLASCSEHRVDPPLCAAIDTDGGLAGTESARLLFDILGGTVAPGVRRKLSLAVRRVDGIPA